MIRKFSLLPGDVSYVDLSSGPMKDGYSLPECMSESEYFGTRTFGVRTFTPCRIIYRPRTKLSRMLASLRHNNGATMTLLDLIVIAITIAVCRFIPEFAFWGVAFTVTLALILERLIRGERVATTRTP